MNIGDIDKNAALQRLTLFIVFFISLFFLLSLEHTAAPLTKDGVHFQHYTSDHLMQSLKSSSLREHPFKSLWYLHKLPPLYDGIRALIIGCLQNVPGEAILLKLDQSIYAIWAVCYGIMAMLVYQWLSLLTSRRFAFYLSMVWILHPAPIYYATYTDPTILVSLGVLWLFYELWLFYSKSGSVIRLALSATLLFYLRSSFPWYFFVLLTVCLMLMKIPRKQLMKFILISAILITPYLVKQYHVFKVIDSTNLGYHRYFLVAGDSHPIAEARAIGAAIPWRYPKEASLSVGCLNAEPFWRENFGYHKLANQYILAHPFESLKNIARTFFVYNWTGYWRPSWNFCGPNHVVLLLPWQDALKVFLTYPTTFIILVFAILLWRRGRKEAGLSVFDDRILGLILPWIYIFLTSTLVNGDGKGATESIRYKFFLEPVYYVFIMAQIYRLLVVGESQTK